MTVIKICTKCETEKPATLEFFYRNKRMRDGLLSDCKSCCGIITGEYQRSEKGKMFKQEYNKRYNNTISGYLRGIYANIKGRCTNPIYHNYKSYNNLGIKNKFKSLNGFRDYVMNVLEIDPRGLQIHRIDNNGHYERGNIEFLTPVKHRQLHGKGVEL